MLFIILVIIGFSVLVWFNIPTCAACGKMILEDSCIHVGSPANVSIHRACEDTWDKMCKKEPYASRTKEYINLLDRKRVGEDISEQEWKDFHRRP